MKHVEFNIDDNGDLIPNSYDEREIDPRDQWSSWWFLKHQRDGLRCGGCKTPSQCGATVMPLCHMSMPPEFMRPYQTFR